ncbi:R3H domain-containing protein 2, partial [Linnemannia elongata]
SLDEVLLTALQNRQDRLFLLKLEREYCNFIEDPSKELLEFPWLNSYFRMMIHRSAIYYRLARTVDAAQKKIVLSKTEHSAIPELRFQELVEEEDDVPVKSFRVLRRSPPRPVSACEARESTMTATTIPGVASSAPTQSSPWQGPEGQSTRSGSIRRGTGGTLEQREAAYAKARARIFDTGDEDEEEKENDREEHNHPCHDASSTPRGEARRSPSVTSGTSSSTARTIASTADSLSNLDLSYGHGNSKARSDITRRTSTNSTISSSSSSSGTTMADISARTDFVGSWMIGSGGYSMPHPPSGMYDHRSVARNNASYCECGADHGSVGHDIVTGIQNNNPSRRASCACHHNRHQPQESYHHHHPAVCSCQNSHGSSQQSSSSVRHPSSVHGGYSAATTLPRHQQPQRQQQHQQQRLFSPCNQHHYPQQYQHHPHQHQHQYQHQHQHHPGYQHPVQYGHAHVCARLDPQAQHQHQHQHQGHQQHRQTHFNQQYQTHHHQQPHQPHCFIPHHASSHHHHQHNRGSGGSNSGFQDLRWLDCIARPEMPSSHQNASPTNSVSGMVMESNPITIQDVPPPHPGLFQVSVRPYPSSNGYRPYRQGISLPQQMTRQAQQRQHHHHPGQGQTQGQQGQGLNQSGQRQYQQRQQGSAPNTRLQQQQQRGQQQPQQHQQQKLSVGSIDHPHSPAPSSSYASPSSSTSSSSSTKRHSYGGNEGRKEERAASSHTRHHNHHQQEQRHQQQDTMKSREDSVHVPITVYDVERRPPKSTELYDPYAATNTPACGSGSKSRDRHKH